MISTGIPGSEHDLSERIGPYRLLQVLGEGGMGIVYDAEETEPVRRRVALKVLKDLHAPRDVIARFEVERQALAVMDHPGIARVYAAGTTARGQPYFAMELVRGVPITQFCDEHRLSVRQRLELFVGVCHAVQHAHQKGLIHRDLKPSNILVTDVDGEPRPKVIDFGIAKAIGQQLTEKTLVTLAGHAVGTLAYMSPEQAESGIADVDTRADIYSLGVILYELLVGRLPSDPAAVGMHVYLARLMARESDPPTPSTRVASGDLDLTTVAKTRRTDLPHLRRELRGDLDWIVMKAMDPDRSRRYATANGLALDILRYLGDEPIVARPPSAGYRLKKFVHRHRAATAVGAFALFAVIMGSVFTTVGMIRATRAERLAAQEAAAARQVTDFLIDIFRIANPSEARGNAVTARELLDRGAARIDRDLAASPELQARLLHTMGTAYGALGLYPQAERLLGQALHTRERTFGPNDTLVAATLGVLGAFAMQRGNYDESERHLVRARDIREAALGATHADVGSAYGTLATLRMRQGRFADAESLALHALRIHDRPGVEPLLRARTMMRLGAVLLSTGRYDEAEQMMRRSLAIREEALDPDDPQIAETLNNLGIVAFLTGRYEEALGLYGRTRGIYERTFPADHPDVSANLNNLGETYWKLGRVVEAESLFRRSLAIKERTLAPSSPAFAVTLVGLAGVLRDRQRFAEAEPLYQRALALRRLAFGDAHPVTTEVRREYGLMLRRAGRPAEAAAMEQSP